MPARYDVVVLGGALAGGSTALLLRRRHPEWKVLVIEKSTAFDFKVGESTVEVSSYFLTRVLRLYDHLSREHLPKHGLRYWFHNGAVKKLADASEVGPTTLSRIGTFQIDRSKLDEHVLALAAREGAEVWRPAKVLDVQLPEEAEGPESVIRIERDGETVEVRAGWLVDATGRSAVVARRRGWLKPIESHPTAAVWARYRGVKDMDGPEVAGNDPDTPFSRGCVAARRLATNHFNGYGYWIWFIPLQGGETSIGAVWDTRLVQPRGTGAEEKLHWFLDRNPLTRDLVADARRVPDDLFSYAHLPYLVDRVAGVGWSSVGDAAGFLDPFYSPGIDQLAFSVSWTLELLKRRQEEPDPMKFAAEVREHDDLYRRFLGAFYDAIYKDKYYLMGDYDTMTASFLLDTALYYMFIIWPVHRSSRGLLYPPFYRKYAIVGMYPIRFYQRRLISIAKRRMRLGIYGSRNAGRRPRLLGFTLGATTIWLFIQGLARYVRAEAENAWTYIARPKPLRAGMPAPYAPPIEPEAAKVPAP